MNSVHLYVKDACGDSFLDTFTANTPENIAKFRNHVQWCKKYWGTTEYRNKVHPSRWPAMPVKIIIDEYEDISQ